MLTLFKVHKPKYVEDKINAVLNSSYWAEGESVKEFEQYLSRFFGNDKVITTNSCTSALHIALHVAGVSRDDYVLTTPMTCIASTVSITNLGAIPLWVDVDPQHGMITSKTLLNAWCALSPDIRKKIKCVLYVCWGGDMGPLDEVADTCSNLGLKLIVDAAQAFGLQYNAKKARLGDCKYGDMVCFSFQAIKHITTGDGGALSFKNQNDYIRAGRLKWFGIDRDGFRTPNGEINWDSDIPEIGYKFHMNNIAGSIGCAQMQEVHELEERLNLYKLNDSILSNLMPYKRSWCGPSASWVATFNVNNPNKMIEFFRANDVHLSQMHVNNDIYTAFGADSKIMSLNGVKAFMDTHLCFPCGYWVTRQDINKMVDLATKYKQNGE